MTEPAVLQVTTVFDCPDPATAAAFWMNILGYQVHSSDPEWFTIADPQDYGRRLAFQRIETYRAPTWPGPGVPQQAHLDLVVADLDAMDRKVLDAGATRLSALVTEDDETFRVYADPAGHPFCLIVNS